MRNGGKYKLNENYKENAIWDPLLCKNYYILQPYSYTISCDHWITESKIKVYFSSLKIPVSREPKKQKHKLNSHYIKNEPQAFWVTLQWICVLKWKGAVTDLWPLKLSGIHKWGCTFLWEGGHLWKWTPSISICTKDYIACFNCCTKTLYRIRGWNSQRRKQRMMPDESVQEGEFLTVATSYSDETGSPLPLFICLWGYRRWSLDKVLSQFLDLNLRDEMYSLRKNASLMLTFVIRSNELDFLLLLFWQHNYNSEENQLIILGNPKILLQWCG